MANVGKHIRLLRKQKNMTQDALAERLYVSRQTVSNYETGKSNPDIDMLVKIAEVLEADVNDLIFGLPPAPSRRKDQMRLFGTALVLLILGVLYVYLRDLAEEWRRNRFDYGPALALQMLLRPGMYLLCGFTIMQAVSLLWGIKRQRQAAFRAVFRGTVLLLAAVVLVTVPFCAEQLLASWKLYRALDPSGIPYYLPEVWSRMAFRLWKIMAGYPFLFLPMGMILWNGEGEKP